MSYDVIVVGAGIIGSSIAYQVSKEGLRVGVFEREVGGGQTSVVAAGMLAPLAEAPHPGPFVELALAGFRCYPELVGELKEETEVDVELLSSGILRLALTPAEAEELRRRLDWQKELGLPLEWLSPEELRQREPAVTPNVEGALFSPEEKQLQPGRLLSALRRAAAKRGAEFYYATPVVGLAQNGSRVRGVKTPFAEYSADQVVLAAGSWAGLYGEWLGLPLPVRPVRGQILACQPRVPSLTRIVFSSKGYLVPRADGTMVIGATQEEAGFDAQPTAGGVAGLLRSALELVPSLAGANFQGASAGLRPASQDGLPLLGPVPGWEGINLAAGHFRNGILLGPITGELLAQQLLGRTLSLDLSPFSAGRFAPAGAQR